MKKVIYIVLTFCLASCIGQTNTTDIIVVGGGASGVTAAISAAKNGANVIVLEETPWLGGMLTSAGVSAIDGNYNIRGGLFAEFCDSLAVNYGGYDSLKTGWVSHILFEPSVGNRVLNNMVAAYSNIKVVYGAKVEGVSKDSSLWNVNLVVDGKEFAYKSKVLIDATELGDIAAQVGVSYDLGMDSRFDSGEDIIQDLTYVAVLKDYGEGTDVTIEKPMNYDPSFFYCSTKSDKCVNPKPGQALWEKDKMITYGKLPNNKYMINWPIDGNDCYLNLIESTPEDRARLLKKAKDFTLSFVYYIQTELGMKNLGLADDEFPTEDKLPFIPYHRESRRIDGEVRFSINNVTRPYDNLIYRTGIGVGDYPVDHHHNRHPEWDKLPELHFYPVPSYSIPLGVMIPKDVDDLIVVEKSISVSNLLNGSTRLQPVVMQLGEAAGVLAALSVERGERVRDVSVRAVQSKLLEQGAFLAPYLDLPRTHKHFAALQRIGLTGILKSEGKNVGWSNQTWFNADKLTSGDELLKGLKDYYPELKFDLIGRYLTVDELAKIVQELAQIDEINADYWESLGLTDFDLSRNVSRLEAAVVIDDILDPFNMFQINIKGELGTDYTQYVNPIIGTGGHGHVFVGASTPHGMVQVGPNNLTRGWDWCSGYHDSDSTIIGFAQTHLSGTGISDLGDIVLMPVSGTPSIKRSIPENLEYGFASGFDKKKQVLSPYYYGVHLDRYDIDVELTATDRVAHHRYNYNEKDSVSSVILDLFESAQSLMFRQGCIESGVEFREKDQLVLGYRLSNEWAMAHKVFFAIEFTKPIIDYVIYSDDMPLDVASAKGDNLKMRLNFGDVAQLDARVGISYTDQEGAIKNLNAEKGYFEEVKAKAHCKWMEELSRIEYSSDSEESMEIFYTSLYHTSISPSLFADVDNRYMGADGRVYKAEGFIPYTVFSLWDTYRAVHPLFTLIDSRSADYVNSMVDIEQKQGRMPVWHLVGNETDCMVGVHSIAVAADAVLKGIPGVDAQEVFDAVKGFKDYNHAGLPYILEYGYLPADKELWSVAKALEYTVDDYAISLLAEKVGDMQSAELYAERASSYTKYFDKETGFMRGRMSDGSWRTPFDPFKSIHLEDDYVEGNAWQYTWLTAHDIDGAVEMFGGKDKYFAKLDSLFLVSSELNEGASVDITGMIGQYAHGNEPSHHILYIYPYLGEIEKGAKLIGQVYDSFYTTDADGLIGNEDAGQMSAWYVMSSLGFYQMNPVGGEYVFGQPKLKGATINLINGNRLKINSVGAKAEDSLVEDIDFNGDDIDGYMIDYSDLMKGGTLTYKRK